MPLATIICAFHLGAVGLENKVREQELIAGLAKRLYEVRAVVDAILTNNEAIDKTRECKRAYQLKGPIEKNIEHSSAIGENRKRHHHYPRSLCWSLPKC